MELLGGLSALVSVVALSLAASAFRLARASAPNHMLLQIKALHEAVQTCEIRCETSESRIQQYAAENAALRESIEGVLTSVEKKRRQTAASESRLNREEPEVQQPLQVEAMSRAELKIVARQRGLLS